MGVEGHKQGGPPVKEVLLLSRRFSCQGGWHREEEGEKDRGERDRSAVGILWKEIPPVKEDLLLSRRFFFCESIFVFANPGYCLRIHDYFFFANPGYLF